MRKIVPIFETLKIIISYYFVCCIHFSKDIAFPKFYDNFIFGFLIYLEKFVPAVFDKSVKSEKENVVQY